MTMGKKILDSYEPMNPELNKMLDSKTTNNSIYKSSHNGDSVNIGSVVKPALKKKDR